MNTYNNTHKKGFIALFFTLSISSILLACVSINSERVFDFIHNRQVFIDNRTYMEKTIMCADGFVDILIRSGVVQSVYQYDYMFEGNTCVAKSIDITYQNPDNTAFSFNIEKIHIEGIITRGFISEIYSSRISL